jgi:uncharacterized protein YyaL (SSP411 family)
MIRNISDTLNLFGLRKSLSDDFILQQHVNAAVEWIIKAYQVTGNNGISKGYDLIRRSWSPPYPETTGYLITTILNVAYRYKRPELNAVAFSLAGYLKSCLTPTGGLAHWQDHARSYPIVFDTGQAIFGWLAAYHKSKDEEYLKLAEQSAAWLISIQADSGAWEESQYLGVTKVIDTRVAWALLELYQITRQEFLIHTVVKNLEWAAKQQRANGWFEKCAFRKGDHPITHTLAYTIEGMLQCGLLLDEHRYIDTARLTARALMENQREDGSLAGTFGPNWEETSRSSCLTGNCQMSSIWLNFYKLEGEKKFLEATRKAIAFVASTQLLESHNENIRGGIAGSYPIYGSYERLKYPNWAVKFFIDALLLLDHIEYQSVYPTYVG